MLREKRRARRASGASASAVRGLAVVLVLAGSAAVSACVTTSSQTLVPASQSPGPALTVERFLRAANANELVEMTQLFGTHNKNIVGLEGETRAERRMYVLASLLRHDDWSIMGQEQVPGRMRDATNLLVQITRQDESVTIPFLVVRRDRGGWIIEKIDVEPLTKLP